MTSSGVIKKIKGRSERSRDTHLRNTYGISLKQHSRLSSEQNDVCFICHKTDCYSDYLAVDHCHTTNVVRGLLCRDCNRAIGQLRDNVDYLRRAIEYLTRQPPDLSDLEPKEPAKPHRERARIRYEVTTPSGVFESYDSAAIHYQVHACTIREWCNSNGKHTKVGFSAVKTFKQLD